MSGVGPVVARDLAVWLGVTLLLGAPAAIAAGRALARAWRPFGRAVLYAALLACVADFLCYALFQAPVFALYQIAARAAGGHFVDALSMLTGFVSTWLILITAAFIGWRRARARQMRERYPFLFAPPAGLD